MMATGVVPTPTTDDLPEVAARIGIPEQPELLADIRSMVDQLPEVTKRIEERVRQTLPEIAIELPKLPKASDPELIATPAKVSNPELVARTVNFDLEDAELDANAKGQLEEFVTWLIANPSAQVGVFGHTDLSGDEEYNFALGQSRAEVVVGYLISNGVSASQISIVKSYGETSPMVKVDGYSRANRRVKIEATL